MAALLEASETLYVTMYEPTALTSTGFTVAILLVKLPPHVSVAVAPASV